MNFHTLVIDYLKHFFGNVIKWLLIKCMLFEILPFFIFRTSLAYTKYLWNYFINQTNQLR